MKADALAYSRAASVSLFGLAAQIGLALLLLGYTIFGADPLANTAFWLTALGIPAWLGLLLVYHQHKLERVENAEAEAFAGSTAQQASVFQQSDEDLRVASKRLAWMHAYLLPAISLLIAAGMLAIGWMNIRAARDLTNPETFTTPPYTGWAVAIGLGVGVIGFIFARFVAGMAQQKAWATLRAGAVHSVGASITGLAVALSQGVAYLGSDALYAVMLYALPALMLVIGVEIVLNFILNIYRPRKTGEYPRPAYESRILGFVSAPDRIAESISDAINYQFGWDVSATWFYQLLSRSLLGLFSLALLLLWLLTSLAVVRPDEKGLILRHGAIARAVESGLHIKRPWPMESLETYPARHVSELTVGSEGHVHEDGDDHANEPILWTEAHGTEQLTVIQPSARVAADIEGDLALLVIEAVVQYEVVDLERYMRLAADSTNRDDADATRRELLEAQAGRTLVRFASSLRLDQIIGPGRDRLNARYLETLQQAYDALGEADPETGEPRGAGVNILFAGIANAHPPSSEGVAASFVSVVSAEQSRLALIEAAETDAIETLAGVAGDPALARTINAEIGRLETLRSRNAPESEIVAKELEIQNLLETAGGDAAVLIASARSDRWRRHMQARGDAIRHDGRLALYRAARGPYMAQQYLDAVSGAVRDARLFITAFENPDVRYNFEELETNLADPFNITEGDKF